VIWWYSLPLSEILGPVLGSIAIILTIYLFKRTLDYQSNREIDSNYMEVLKMAIEKPYLRDWIKNYKNDRQYRLVS
jgi:hypothetical protein